MSIVIIRIMGKNMKFNNLLFIFSLLLIALISFSCVVANEDTNITEDSSVLKINDES